MGIRSPLSTIYNDAVPLDRPGYERRARARLSRIPGLPDVPNIPAMPSIAMPKINKCRPLTMILLRDVESPAPSTEQDAAGARFPSRRLQII